MLCKGIFILLYLFFKNLTCTLLIFFLNLFLGNFIHVYNEIQSYLPIIFSFQLLPQPPSWLVLITAKVLLVCPIMYMTMGPSTECETPKSACIFHNKDSFCTNNYSLSIAPQYGVGPGHPAHQCLYLADLTFCGSSADCHKYWEFMIMTVMSQAKGNTSQCFSPSSSSYIISVSSFTMLLSLGSDGVNIKVPFRGESSVFILGALTNYTPLNWLMATAKRSLCEEVWEQQLRAMAIDCCFRDFWGLLDRYLLGRHLMPCPVMSTS